MESRAKQRLTGAIILVALFVLLVPELLTGPGNSHPPAETAGEDGLRRYTIDLDAQNAAAQPAAPPPNETAMNLPAVTPMNPAPALAVPGEAAAPAPAATNPTAQPPPAASVSPRPEQARVEPPRATPAAAPAAATPATAPARVERGNFVVQLGSFGSRENANRLVRDMTAKGFAAFIAPITSNGRELYRVRVGPTHDRASAEALAVELKKLGQTGSIVPIS
jgi:DedD protein